MIDTIYFCPFVSSQQCFVVYCFGYEWVIEGQREDFNSKFEVSDKEKDEDDY